MKSFKLIVLVLIAFQLGCSADKNEVIIQGQFLGEHPKEIGFTYPVNGTSFEGFTEKTELDTTGYFQIILQIERPALISFLSFGSPSLIIEPGNMYDISLSLNETNLLEIGGNISEVQKAYSSFSHQHPMSCLYSYGEEITEYNSIKRNLSSDLQKELSILDELYNQNIINESLFDLLTIDRKIYYYTAQMVLSSRNHLDSRSKNIEVPEEIFDIWQEAAYSLPLNCELFLGSYYSFDFLQMYFLYQTYTTYDFDEFVALRSEKRENRTIHAHNVELAKEYFSGDILEFYIAGSFFEQYRRRQYDKDLNSIFEQFKNDFPNSEYLPFVEKTFKSMIE